MRGGVYGYVFGFDVLGVEGARSAFFSHGGAVGGDGLRPFAPLVDVGGIGFGRGRVFAGGEGEREHCGA